MNTPVLHAPSTPPPTPMSGSTTGKRGCTSVDKQALWNDIQQSLRHSLKHDKRLSAALAVPSMSDSIGDQKNTSGEDEKEQQRECRRYAGVEKFATGFVDSILDAANKMGPILSFVEEESTDTEYDVESLVSSTTLSTSKLWPKIEDFTVEAGEDALDEYIRTWDYQENWLYCIDFIIQQSDDCSDYYIYEVRWSIPTRPYPIPQTTASVYFVLDVSRVKPKYCPVEVFFMFEGSRLLHFPETTVFQEAWLFQIVDAKLTLWRRLDF